MEQGFEQFEEKINELQNFSHGLMGMAGGFVDIALSPFESLFEKDEGGEELYKKLTKEELFEMVHTLNNDIIPLCKEASYKEGIKKAKKFIKLFNKELDT